MFYIKPGKHVWMAECDYGFPRTDTIRELVITSVGKKYFRCSALDDAENNMFEFSIKNGCEHVKDVLDNYSGYDNFRKVFGTKDDIYDICDTRNCLKALRFAAQSNFNGASLGQLDAAADVLGVKYEKAERN